MPTISDIFINFNRQLFTKFYERFQQFLSCWLFLMFQTMRLESATVVLVGGTRKNMIHVMYHLVAQF